MRCKKQHQGKKKNLPFIVATNGPWGGATTTGADATPPPPHSYLPKLAGGGSFPHQGQILNCSDVPDIFPMACDRRLATTGKGVALRLPTSGREVGWRVPTCGLPRTSSKSAWGSDSWTPLFLVRPSGEVS